MASACRDPASCMMANRCRLGRGSSQAACGIRGADTQLLLLGAQQSAGMWPTCPAPHAPANTGGSLSSCVRASLGLAIPRTQFATAANAAATPAIIMSRTGCQPRASAMSCEAAHEAAAAASVREADSAVRGAAGGAAAAALPAGRRRRAFPSRAEQHTPYCPFRNVNVLHPDNSGDTGSHSSQGTSSTEGARRERRPHGGHAAAPAHCSGWQTPPRGHAFLGSAAPASVDALAAGS